MGSVINEKASVDIHVRELGYSFSVRLPDYTPLFETGMMAMILTSRKVPPKFNKVKTPDSQLECDSLDRGMMSQHFREFCASVLTNITKIVLGWVPGHMDIFTTRLPATSFDFLFVFFLF